MTLYIKTLSSKDDFGFSTDCSVFENMDTNFHNHLFSMSFNVFASKAEISGNKNADCEGKEELIQVGEISATFIDEDLCLDTGLDIVYVADSADQDIFEAIETMAYSTAYKKLSVNKEWRPLLSAYLEHFYVYPEYRNKGIGTYLINNLEEIFRTYTNRDIHAVVAFLKPLPLRGETMTEEEEAAMLRKMQRHFHRAGFKKIRNSECYMNNYGATD